MRRWQRIAPRRGFDIAAQHKNIAAWLERIKALPRWKHPYDLMPGHPLQR
jgi:glutathione S-transferase